MRPAAGLVLALALLLARPAQASFLDRSFTCLIFGCVVLMTEDGIEVYVSATVPRGSPMQLVAVGGRALPISAVLTGTQDPAQPPGSGQGSLLGIDQDGDGRIDLAVVDDGSGFLDAGDGLRAVRLSSPAGLELEDTTHSFYVGSNVAFDIRARVVARATPGFAGISEAIRYAASVRESGNDGGFSYGNRSTARFFRALPGIGTLGDIGPGPTRVVRFAGPTLTGPGALQRQLVRLTHDYDFPDYDLSRGDGGVEVDVTYEVTRP